MNLYIQIIGGPGTGKTIAAKAAKKALEEAINSKVLILHEGRKATEVEKGLFDCIIEEMIPKRKPKV